MRIPGLGGEVLKRAGGTPVNLPGGELFTSLQSGAIDATEWVGPYNDLAFGLYKAAKYYYYPGWHEPGTTLEAMINKDAFDGAARRPAVHRAQRLQGGEPGHAGGVHRPQPGRPADPAQEARRRHAPLSGRRHRQAASSFPSEVVSEIAQKDEFSQKVYASYQKFLQQSKEWSSISELAYLQARARG